MKNVILSALTVLSITAFANSPRVEEVYKNGIPFKEITHPQVVIAPQDNGLDPETEEVMISDYPDQVMTGFNQQQYPSPEGLEVRGVRIFHYNCKWDANGKFEDGGVYMYLPVDTSEYNGKGSVDDGLVKIADLSAKDCGD